MSIMRVTMTATYLGQKLQNVMHFNNPDDALTHTQVKDAFQAGYFANIKNVLNAGFVETEVRVQKVDGTPDTPSVFPIAGQAGSLSGGGAPSFVAGLIRIKTASSGRHGHGRIYQGGVHGESLLNGVFQADAWAAWQTYVANIQNYFKVGGSGPMTMCVVKRGAITTSDAYLMTALVVPQIFGVQRRRNIGVGA